MRSESTSDGVSTIAPNIVRTTPDSIRGHFKTGERGRYEWTEVVGQAREKLGKGLSENEQGLVIGVGERSDQWKGKGFKTLDIVNRPGVDITADFNRVTDSHPELVGKLTIIYAENIAFDPRAKTGVHAARLIREANRLLIPGGLLVVKTGWHTHPLTTLPEKEQFEETMFRLGFDGIVSERHTITTDVYQPIDHNGKPIIADSQDVIYYALKAEEIPDTLSPGHRSTPGILEEF